MSSMRTLAAVGAAFVLLAGCRSKVRDPKTGTVELVFAPVPKGGGETPPQLLEDARKPLAKRLDGLGAPYELAVQGGRLTVALPGDADAATIARAKELASIPGRLEIREVADQALADLERRVQPPAAFVKVPPNPGPGQPYSATVQAVSWEELEAAQRSLQLAIPEGTAFGVQPPEQPLQPWRLLLLGAVAVDGTGVKDATWTMAGNKPAVLVQLRSDAAERFEEATRRSFQRRLAIAFDDVVVMTPYVTGPIPGGAIQIGLGANATAERATAVAIIMKTGKPLPVRLQLVDERHLPGK